MFLSEGVFSAIHTVKQEDSGATYGYFGTIVFLRVK